MLWSLQAQAQSPEKAKPRPGQTAQPSTQPTAQSAGTEEARDYVTVVTARKQEALGPSVKTIQRQTIQSLSAQSLAEVLEQDAAIHATTGSRGERIFSWRGFSQRQITVLLDGAPAYIPYDGQVDLGMVPAELVEQVTVIKGPASVLYGPNGMGGAVNIVTRRPGVGPLFEASVEAGRSNALRLWASHDLRVSNRLAYTVHGGLNQREAFALSSRFAPTPNENGVLRENSDQQAYHLGGRLLVQPATTHQIELGATFIEGERGVPGSTLERPPRYWRFSTWRAAHFTVSHVGRYGDRLTLDEQLFGALFDNLLDAYDDATFSSQALPLAFHSWFHDRILGGRVRAQAELGQAPWGETRVRFWTSLQHDQHHKDQGDDALAPYTRTLVTLAPEVEASVGSSWGLDMGITLGFQLDLEALEDHSDPTVGWGPLVALRWNPSSRIRLQATAARRTRFPTLKERYSSGLGLREVNPDLKPEVAWNLGIDASYSPLRWITVQAALFDAEVESLIEQLYMAGGVDRLVNTGAARFLGAELGLQVRPWPWLHALAAYHVLVARRAEELSGSDRLQYQPAHKAVFQIQVKPIKIMELSTQLQVIGPQDFLHPETSAWGQLGAYVRWDARLAVKPLPMIETWVSVKNLLDANYQTHYGFPDPGWQVLAGLRFEVFPRDH